MNPADGTTNHKTDRPRVAPPPDGNLEATDDLHETCKFAHQIGVTLRTATSREDVTSNCLAPPLGPKVFETADRSVRPEGRGGNHHEPRPAKTVTARRPNKMLRMPPRSGEELEGPARTDTPNPKGQGIRQQKYRL